MGKTQEDLARRLNVSQMTLPRALRNRILRAAKLYGYSIEANHAAEVMRRRARGEPLRAFILLGSWLLASVVCPNLFAETVSATPKPPFSIAIKPPPVVKGTPCAFPLLFTVTDNLNSKRTITLTNELRDVSGKTVWSGKAVRLSFKKERSLGISVTLALPALPPGRYTLVSLIPDAQRPPPTARPAMPDADLSIADIPVMEDAAQQPPPLPPPLKVETAITIEAAPDTVEEPFTLVIETPPVFPPGPILLAVTITVTRVDSPESNPVLVTELMDDRERVFWREERPLAITPDKPVMTSFSITAPPLPAGQYFIVARLRDSGGRFIGPALPTIPEVLEATFNPSKSDPLHKGSVRKPVARLERFEFDRDLLWGTWDGHDMSREESEGVKLAGINTGRRFNYYFRYRWFVDHAPLKSTGLWTEQAFTNRQASGLEHYKRWMGWIENDPGFVVMDMYDELGWSEYDDPAKKRLNTLMAWRVREKTPGVSTIAKWNALMQTDCLGWDEVLHDGFPQATGPNAIKLKWAFQSWVPDLIRLHMAVVRELNPTVQLTPGMGAGLIDNFYDSMHNRAYNKYSTVQIMGLFTAGLPCYGTMPWSWLINLKPPFEQCSRITWGSLAAAGRFFPIYCPGDGYGDRIADAAGKLTPSGEMLKTVHDRIHPLAPVLLGVRNRVETGVLYYHPGWSSLENGLFEGLLACGVQPDCGTNTTGRKLLVLQRSSGAPDTNAIIRAVRDGAGLVFTPDAYSNAAPAFGLTLLPVSIPAGIKHTPAIELDLSVLKESFPGLNGTHVLGIPGGEGVLASDSPLQAVRQGDRTIAWTGVVGKGWVLCLNARLPLNRPASGAFTRAMLDRAGIRESFRFADETGAFHSDILGSVVETADRSQAYVIVVTEAKTNVQSRLYAADPTLHAVRDLCAGRTLEWKQDARGRYVDVNLPKGVGAILSLLKEKPADGRLQVTAPAAVAGGTTLDLVISRLPGNGVPLRTAHTYRVHLLDAGGKELPGLSVWGTGPDPVRLSIPVALTDPDGEWTVLVEDLTDGATAAVKLTKTEAPGGRPVAASLPPKLQPPFRVLLDSTPVLEGDVILVALKGRVTTSLVDAPEVTIEPAVPAGFLMDGPARLTLNPKPGAPAAFVFNYRLSRVDAQSLRGGRNQGVPVRLTSPGLEPIETRWLVPVNPYQRAPHWIGVISGGVVSLRVDNFTDRGREVALSCDPYPGWADGARVAAKRVPPGTTERFEWPVAWADPSKLDPGLAWIPLHATVDGAAFDAGRLFLDQNLEQNWRISMLEMKPWNEAAWETGPAAALDPGDAEIRGWPKVTIGTVLDWPVLTALLLEKGKAPTSLLAAVTDVLSPEAKKVRIGFAGPTAPERIFLNGMPVEADWKALAKKGGVHAEPVELRKGVNTVALEILLPVPETAATSLVIQDAATGRRDRSLIVGSSK